MTASLVWRVRWRDKIIFYPVHLTLFTVLSMRRRNTSGVFIKIPMTRTLDPVTGSNLKTWLQRDNLLRRKWRKQQHKGKPSKTARPIIGPKITSCCRAESQEHAAWRKICEELIVTYISISNVCRHVGLMQPRPKFGACEIFANLFPRQKIGNI